MSPPLTSPADMISSSRLIPSRPTAAPPPDRPAFCDVPAGRAPCTPTAARIRPAVRGASVQQAESPPKAWRVRQVARALSLAPSSLYRAIAAGDLAVVKIGKTILILDADLQAFLAERRRGATR